MSPLHNRKYLKPIRKSLRNNSTSAEATLWNMLKKSQVGVYKFRRQHSIGKYVVDFYCPTLKLAIELDGEPHAELVNIQLNAERDEFINNHGITIFRYENRWVFEYRDVIIQEILEFGGGKGLKTTSPRQVEVLLLFGRRNLCCNQNLKFKSKLNREISPPSYPKGG